MGKIILHQGIPPSGCRESPLGVVLTLHSNASGAIEIGIKSNQQPDLHQETVTMLRFASLTIIACVLISLAALPCAWAEKPTLRSPVVSGAELGDSPQITLRAGSVQSEALQDAAAAGLNGLSRMELELLTSVARAASIEVVFTKLNWAQQQEALLSGRIDLAFGAYQPEFGDARFHYSIPYRPAPVALYIRVEDEDRYDLSDVASLLRESQKLKLGIVAGQSFQDSRIYSVFEAAARDRRLVVAYDLEENLKNLANGRIDGFIGERLDTAASAMDMKLLHIVHEAIPLGTWNVHAIFSKTTVTEEMVERFNAAIRATTNDGEMKKIIHRSKFSVIATYFFNSTLFVVLEVIGCIAFAISGVLIAYRDRFSIVGAFVLAALPAVGGDTLRDLIFDRHPISVLATPLYLCTVGLTVLIGYAFIRLMQLLHRRRYWFDAGVKFPAFVNIKNVYEFTDAIGIGAFTASGVAVAVLVGADPLWLWAPISAALSAAGGGILRDIVRQSGRVDTLKTEFYAEVPIIWGALFSVFIMLQPTLIVPEIFVVAIGLMLFGSVLTRLAVVWFGIRAIRYW